MKNRPLGIVVVLTILFGATGCSLVDSDNEEDEFERSLPHAFNLETVTIQELREAAAPDSLNIAVFVVGISVCPDNTYCFLPDGITVAESLNPESPEEQMRFSLKEPRQFEEGQFYLLSVELRTNSSGSRTSFDLIGYSKLEGNVTN